MRKQGVSLIGLGVMVIAGAVGILYWHAVPKTVEPKINEAQVHTCSMKGGAIRLALDKGNYCVTDSDCKFFQPDGFECWRYVNQSFNTSTILNKIGDYGKSCSFTAYKCPTVRPARCIQKKCTTRYR